MAGKRLEDLTGLVTHTWIVGDYVGKSKYECKCKVCGNIQIVDNYSLKKSGGPKCTACTGKNSKGLIDLKGKTFGYWEVLEYAGDKKWKCKCHCTSDCDTIRIVKGEDLRNGKSTSCGKLTNQKFYDLTDQQFGDWKVISYDKDKAKWLCECQCSLHTQQYLTSYQLRNGLSKSCGHNTTGFKDLTGMKFGEWTVLRKSPIQLSDKPGSGVMWECQCSCDKHTIRDVGSYQLRNGLSRSCGCKSNDIRKETCMKKYGVESAGQINTTRSKQQLDMIKSRENLIMAIQDNFDKKPSITKLSKLLGVTRGSTWSIIHKYGLNDYIANGAAPVSGYEKWLDQLFPCEHVNDRKALKGQELDLYYPESNFAIEFNGNYWHSELNKDNNNYHQEKTLKAAKVGIDLFHIFEYEWVNKDQREKIINLINDRLYTDKLEKVQARKCVVGNLKKGIAIEFIEKYHLQGYSNSQIFIGIALDQELLGVMTFGKPRFNKEYEYELIRLVFKPGYSIIGGAERMFSYFINRYSPSSIITYCDITKFTGRVYEKLGFNEINLTSPNYKWVDIETNDVKSRYQTMKKDLVAAGLGTDEQTEDEIMNDLGYFKVYDCGNLVFAWENY
jgi:hypothetical protein